MILGRFGDTTGRPYVEGRLSLPHQDVWANCSFIVDTGAERSVLLPVDARRMGLDRSKLRDPATTLGFGRYVSGFNEFAMLWLHDNGEDESTHGTVYEFRLTNRIFIPDDSQELREIDASILGRDVLDQMHLVYNRAKDLLTLDPVTTDRHWHVQRRFARHTPLAPGDKLEE